VSENVQVARRYIEAINTRDRDALGRLVHRDFELHNPWTPGGGIFRGIEAIEQFANEFGDSWEKFTIEEQQIIEAGETVVMLGHAHAMGAASRVTLDSPIGHVHTVRDGKLARTHVFLDHAQALKAAGLASHP
jgi:ketosteroid isomerase-like protein